MDISTIICCIYILIGIIVLIYDYQKYQKKSYELAKKNNMADDSMMCMYMMTVILLWPIKIALYFRKND